jgi:quercetin dioxygenase-like cupin family protein
MIRGILIALFVLCVGSSVLAQDPVKVDANHYKVEFENSEVRVLRVRVGAGEKSIMHRHPNAVAIFMTDINGKFTFPGGKTEATTRKAGDVLWTPAITHLPENTGTEPFEVVLVELKSKPGKKGHHSGRRRQ